MARRHRHTRKPAVPRKPAERDHMARVHVADDVWADFKTAAGNVPISVVLGQLVQRHVDRHRSRRLKEGRLDDQELLEALDRARELHADIGEIVARVERRLERRATTHPGGVA